MEGSKPKPNEMSDAVLSRAYQHTTGGVHDMVANAILAEIKRRDLDI
jgi:hypothetical protein